MRCILLDIEKPLGKKCPSICNLHGFNCYKSCGFSELIEKSKNEGRKMGKKRRLMKYVVIDLPEEDETKEESEREKNQKKDKNNSANF